MGVCKRSKRQLLAANLLAIRGVTLTLTGGEKQWGGILLESHLVSGRSRKHSKVVKRYSKPLIQKTSIKLKSKFEHHKINSILQHPRQDFVV